MIQGDPTHFRFRIEQGVGVLTLSRPDRLNSLTFDSYAELAAFLPQMSTDPRVRSVVITGEGRGFCSGGDVDDIIAELFRRDAAGLLAFTRLTGELIHNLRRVSQPVVAAVNGVAVGAGAVIATACDLRVFSERARIGFIFPRVGLCGADMGAAFLLPRIVGHGRASELLLLGDLVDAAEAHRIGLANRVVVPERTLDEAMQWAVRLAQGPAFANVMTKRMLDAEAHMALPDAIEAEAQAQALCMLHPDFRTAFEANKARQPARFAGAPAREDGP